MAVLVDKKISQNEADYIQAPMEQDLIALFKTLNEAVFEIMDLAQKEGWTPEHLIKEVEDLFDDEGSQNVIKDMYYNLKNLLKNVKERADANT